MLFVMMCITRVWSPWNRRAKLLTLLSSVVTIYATCFSTQLLSVSLSAVYVSYVVRNKHLLFPLRALSGCLLSWRHGVFPVRLEMYFFFNVIQMISDFKGLKANHISQDDDT
jgi:hypothetical protein